MKRFLVTHNVFILGRFELLLGNDHNKPNKTLWATIVGELPEGCFLTRKSDSLLR